MILAVELALHRVTCAIASCAVQQGLSVAAIDKVPAEALITQLLLLWRLLLLLLWLLLLLLLLQVNVSCSWRSSNSTVGRRSRRYQCRIVWRIVSGRRLAIAHFLWETKIGKGEKRFSISVTFRTSFRMGIILY